MMSNSEHNGKHFVIQKGKAICDKGTSFPNFKVTSHQKHYWNSAEAGNDYLAVTEDDLQFNPATVPFGNCSVKNGQPCSFAPAGKWQKPYDKVKVMGKSCLTEISELQCSVGGKIYVFSLEKLLSNNDVEKYKILDTLNIGSDLNIIKLAIKGDNNKIMLTNNSKELKHWKFTTDKVNINVWNGTYNIGIDYGKLDDFSEMSIDYDIEINDKKCTFSGMGYKTYFTDLCEVEEKNNKLILKYIKTIDGDDLSDHSNVNILGIMEYKNNEYYLKSSIVADKNWNYNSDVKLDKIE